MWPTWCPRGPPSPSPGPPLCPKQGLLLLDKSCPSGPNPKPFFKGSSGREGLNQRFMKIHLQSCQKRCLTGEKSVSQLPPPPKRERRLRPFKIFCAQIDWIRAKLEAAGRKNAASNEAPLVFPHWKYTQQDNLRLRNINERLTCVMSGRRRQTRRSLVMLYGGRRGRRRGRSSTTERCQHDDGKTSLGEEKMPSAGFSFFRSSPFFWLPIWRSTLLCWPNELNWALWSISSPFRGFSRAAAAHGGGGQSEGRERTEKGGAYGAPPPF